MAGSGCMPCLRICPIITTAVTSRTSVCQRGFMHASPISQSRNLKPILGIIVSGESAHRPHSSRQRLASRGGAAEGGATVGRDHESGAGGGGSGGDGGGGGSGDGSGSGEDSGSSGGGDRSGGISQLMTVILAVAVIGGGTFAYVKKGSKMSLRASCGVGGALLAAAWLMGSFPTAGVSLALATTLALAVAMGKRYKSSGKVMPSGALTVVAAIYSLAYGSSLVSLAK